MRTRLLGVSMMAAVTLLTGCATAVSAPAGAPAPGLGAVAPAPPSGDVIGQGMVLDVNGAVVLCLGAVMESYPPKCGGTPLAGWSWDGVGGSESSDRTRWGAYAVQGTFDGETLTVTRPPILLALFDPMARPDPTGGSTGTADEQTLLDIQEALPDLLGDSYLGSGPQDGRLRVQVVWDDGALQDAADTAYGESVVIIESALLTVG